MKHRMLNHEGWQVVHIPFYAWNKQMTNSERFEYCADLLESEII